MREFIVNDYHNDFIKYCDKVINENIEIIHDKCKDLYSLRNHIIDNNYNLLVKYSIPLNDIIDRHCKGSHLPLTKDNDENLFISNYNHLLTIIDSIPKIAMTVNRHSFLKKIPLSVFQIILFAGNFEYTRNILRGDRVRIPKIGELYIGRVPYDSSFPDWGASKRFKQELNAQGIATKDKDNPNGKLWFVDNGLNRDDFYLLRWAKRNSKLKNKAIYRFNASVFGNFSPKNVDKHYTIAELTDKTNTGLFDKIIHIYRFHYEYGQDNYPFINYQLNKNKNKV